MEGIKLKDIGLYTIEANARRICNNRVHTKIHASISLSFPGFTSSIFMQDTVALGGKNCGYIPVYEDNLITLKAGYGQK